MKGHTQRNEARFMQYIVIYMRTFFKPLNGLQRGTLTVILRHDHMKAWFQEYAMIWGPLMQNFLNLDLHIFSPSFLGYQDGLSWHLCALKTRKPRFQTICSHRSLLCQLWPHGLIPVCWLRRRIRELYWQKCGCCLEKWSGWNLTNRTGGYGPALECMFPVYIIPLNTCLCT